MRKTTSCKIIRFRRWARKAYAIFSTLGCCVTIGRLGRKVVDASLKKQKAGIPVNPERTDKGAPYEEEPEEVLPYDILFRSGLISQHLLTDETYCINYNYIETKLKTLAGRILIYLSGLFFSYKTIYYDK